MDNLNAFVGLSFNHDDRFLIIWQYSVRCTLEDIVMNEDFNLTIEFQTSFLKGIVKVSSYSIGLKHVLYQGLDYLHSSLVGVHGALNIRNCLITQYWSVRISEFGMNAVVDNLAERNIIDL